ncbi:MAG TPA: hypothetical protein VK796_07905 [Cytophaga sp.]|nr:hypothetical protein [Cytophaga sp.]
MHSIQSFISAKGSTTIGGISFYYCEGQLRMRQASGPSKKQIKTKASCRPIRNNNAEFGFASKISKSLRTRIGSGLTDFADSQISGRLTGMIRNIIKRGAGVAGARAFNPYMQAALLSGFECNRHRTFQDVWKPAITCTSTGNAYMLQTRVSPQVDIQAPADATHAQLTVISLHVPVIGYDVARKRYASENARSLHASYKEKADIHSEMLPLNNKEAIAIEMRISGLHKPIENGSGVLLLLYGVRFFKGDVLMREGAAMKVGEVVCTV